MQELSNEQTATFSRSLGWIGTDSEIDLKKLDAKNAKEIVKIAIVLKANNLPILILVCSAILSIGSIRIILLI